MPRGAIGNTFLVSSVASSTNDLVLALPVTPKAAMAARRALVAEGLDPDLDHTVCLLTSELVTNAVRHSGMAPSGRIVLAARLSPEFARVEVRDTGHGFDPDIRHSTPGYGLRLTDMLSTRWGVDNDPGGGNRVWFEVDRRRRRFERGRD